MHLVLRTAAAATLINLACAAGAQTVAPPPGPNDRARPEFEPIGGRIGSFMLYPRLSAEVQFNDNVLASAIESEEDVVLNAAAGFSLNSLWLRHKLSVDAQLSQEAYAKLASENALEGRARVEGVFDASRRSSIRASALVEEAAEERFSINSPNDAVGRTRLSRLEANVSYSRDLDPAHLRTEVQLSRLDFRDTRARDGAIIDQDFRDTIYASGSIRGSYRISPPISAVLRVQLDRLDQAKAGQPIPFDRDSTGFRIEGGIGLELSRLLFGDIRLGLLRRSADDDRLPNVTGLSFNLGLTWTPTALTTVRLYADRAVEQGGLVETAGNLRSEGRLDIEHELRRWLILEASARYAVIEPIGAFPKAHDYDGEASATYLISRRFRATATIRHFRRESSNVFTSFAQNRASIALRVSF